MARGKKRITTQPGYVTYLRTSNEDAQAPERSQNGQRRDIQRLLAAYPDLPHLGEYIDNYTGTSADRKHYQRMLSDARKGAFSHVFAAVPDRFERDDVEALRAIDELTALGIVVRFAGHPDLDPADMDDRLYLNILFGMAKREAVVIAKRSTNGMLSKLLNGGWPWRAPDGYLNKEVRLSELGESGAEDRHKHAKYKRWVEIDPEQAKVWRTAWDLLLTDQYTLAEICEDLHGRGYRFRSGRAFVTIRSDGKRKAAANGLSRIFKNWFYAGWVVSEKANIPPKTVRGQWKPLVTTEEFERGLEILAGRQKHRASGGRVHDYLLRGLVYVELDDGKLRRLTGSTPNASRSGGGTSYYCIESSGVNIQCRIVDMQIPSEMMNIQVDPDLLPLIRDSYTDEIADTLGRMRPDQRADLERKLTLLGHNSNIASSP